MCYDKFADAKVVFFGKNAKYLERFLHKTIRKNRKNKDIATKKQKV